MPTPRCGASGYAATANRVSGYATATASWCGHSDTASAAANWIGCHAAFMTLAWSGGTAANRTRRYLLAAAAFQRGLLGRGAKETDLLGR
jgi:hypothetical protein